MAKKAAAKKAPAKKAAAKKPAKKAAKKRAGKRTRGGKTCPPCPPCPKPRAKKGAKKGAKKAAKRSAARRATTKCVDGKIPFLFAVKVAKRCKKGTRLGNVVDESGKSTGLEVRAVKVRCGGGNRKVSCGGVTS